MSMKMSKTNQNLNDLYARLDEIRMSSHERLHAKASLARAEAMANGAAAIINLFSRLAKTLVLRPYRRLTTTLG